MRDTPEVDEVPPPTDVAPYVQNLNSTDSVEVKSPKSHAAFEVLPETVNGVWSEKAPVPILNPQREVLGAVPVTPWSHYKLV